MKGFIELFVPKSSLKTDVLCVCNVNFEKENDTILLLSVSIQLDNAKLFNIVLRYIDNKCLYNMKMSNILVYTTS